MMSEPGETVACFCQGCGVFHVGSTLTCGRKDDANYPYPTYAGQDPAYDAQVEAQYRGSDGGKS